MENNSILDIDKIITGVSGFDDLFYGGLRLPGKRGENKSRDGICIVIYGDRGISKSDLAMQIMRGVDDYFARLYGKDYQMSPKYRTLNQRESELMKKYIGLEVGKMIDDIKLPNIKADATHRCKLCKYFPDMREKLNGLVSTCPPFEQDCDASEIVSCPICKLLRHEIINYSDRSQSMHWTYGDTSNSDNLLAYLKDDAIDKKDIFDQNKDDFVSNSYTSIAIRQFKDFQKEITDKAENLATTSCDDKVGFVWSSYVIEGFTAFRDDELERLPFTDLILKLRKTSAVSILVLDKRGRTLHLNADIIINMRSNTDKAAEYTYYELQIIKSDLQQHVHGWHKYRKLRDLSVKIYPSMHSLLTRRFSSDNAGLRLEQGNLRYPQSLLNRFRYNCSQKMEDKPIKFANVINDVMSDHSEKTVSYNAQNITYSINLIDKQGYDRLFDEISGQVQQDDTTIAVFLLGKTEQHFRKIIQNYSLPEFALRNIHYWETSLGCIWAEEYTSIIKEYVYRWKRLYKHKNLHIIFDDFANINLFPLMERERLLIPVIANICKNASMCLGFDENDREVFVRLSFVCTNNSIPHYETIKQLVDNQ